MNNILGLDLGTNSIAWALRDPGTGRGPEQIIRKGVIIFQKGVGEEKGVEFSLSAERTRLRAARRRNQRRRWRKIDLLTVLAKEGLCPLTTDGLRGWKEPSRKADRKYPLEPGFVSWLRLDFDGDGVADYKNPYELRSAALDRKLSPQELGRICYHFTQRRGYLSNRSDNALEEVEEERSDSDESTPKPHERVGKVAAAIKSLEEGLEGRTIGEALAAEIRAGGRARRRKEESTNIHRLTLQAEYMKIAQFQEIAPALTEKIRKLIFEQRPLRSQKGVVGKCIFEKDKSRCPISHPEFELFRMWQVLNNVRYSTDGRKTWQSLTPELRKEAEPVFFRRSKPAFSFSDVTKALRRKLPGAVYNFRDNQSLSGCPTLSGLMNVLGADRLWCMRDAALHRLKWEREEKRDSPAKLGGKEIDLYDLWHWLFQMDNDKDREIIRRKAMQKLGLGEREAAKFVEIPIKQGYGSLSLKALLKINPWLQQGVRYDQAAFFGNLPTIVGADRWESLKESLIEAVDREIAASSRQKRAVDIANGLISRYNNLPASERFARKAFDYCLDNDDWRDIEAGTIAYFGEEAWVGLLEQERGAIRKEVGILYEGALRKTSSGELGFVRAPRLDQGIREAVAGVLGLEASDKTLDKLYHPSQVEAFLPSLQDSGPEGKKLLNSPRTDSIRNPMAMRALHELRKLVNHLIHGGLVDEYTQVVVEMARELNDANRRKAIEQYQRERERENKEYAAEITKIFAGQGRPLPADLAGYVDRYRLREEQPSHVCMYTGRTISDADLFDEFTTDVEHTIARSRSFDDSLANKTIAFKYYNREIKQKLLPVELPNYSEEAQAFSAIEPRLQFWKDKIEYYQGRIDRASWRSRVAASKEAKDKAIQERHYCILHLRYWRVKLDGFCLEEITEGFKNSQLVDTQIITRYGLMYLRTLFLYVRATKGVITDRVKRIWGVQNKDAAKDRSAHTHHLEDAIIQTLLHKERNKPDVYNLLAEGYKEAEENRWREPQVPNPWGLEPDAFFAVMRGLTDDVLIYHADRDRTMKQTKRKMRNEEGMVFAQGRGIRAPLHRDTFYGAILVPGERRQAGSAEQGENIAGQKTEGVAGQSAGGQLLAKSDGVSGTEKQQKPVLEIRFRTGFVFRGSTAEQTRKAIENIVDSRLRQLATEKGAEAILRDGYFEIPVSEDRRRKDPSAHATKVFKVKVFADAVQNPVKVKPHLETKQEHKRWYYAQTGENYLMALYSNGKERDFELVNTYNVASLTAYGHGLYPASKDRTLRGKTISLALMTRNGKDVVLRKGMKVLLYSASREEIDSDLSLANLRDRLYKIRGLSIQRLKIGNKLYEYGTITLIHHLEAKPASQLKEQAGEYRFGDGKTLRMLKHTQFNGLIEGVDFFMSRLGEVQLISTKDE